MAALPVVVTYGHTLGQKKWRAILVVAAIIASLSRTPMAISAVVLFGYPIIDGKRLWTRQRLGFLALVGVCSYLTITKIPGVSARFTVGDGYSVSGIAVNSSGRSNLWKATWDSAQQSLLFGHYPGYSMEYIRSIFVTIEHPHNEYLRLLNDLGIVGLAFWLTGMAALLYGCWRRFKNTEDQTDKAVHLAAALSVLVILLGSITDNSTVSGGQIIMEGTLIGLSLGRAKMKLHGDEALRVAARSSGGTYPTTRELEQAGLGGWCRTGVYGAGVIDSGGREWFNGCSPFCQSCWWQWVSGLLQPVGDGRQCHVSLSSALGVPRWVSWGPPPTLALLPG